LIAATLPASASPASSTYASTPADQARVVEAMRTMYAAAAADDVDKFHTIAARTSVPSTAASAMTATLMKIAKSFHDSGKVFVSTVTDPHVEANCDLAWLTYTNRGSMATPPAQRNSPGSNRQCSKSKPVPGASASSTAPGFRKLTCPHHRESRTEGSVVRLHHRKVSQKMRSNSSSSLSGRL
jgi:hypothetical protein